MKITIPVSTEIIIKAIKIVAPDRYDGEDFENYPKELPHYNGDSLTVVLELETCRVRDWPVGTPWDYYGKVCDEGSYYLLGEGDEVLATRTDDYVPSCVPGDHGDYIRLKINERGELDDWAPSAVAILESFYGQE